MSQMMLEPRSARAVRDDFLPFSPSPESLLRSMHMPASTSDPDPAATSDPISASKSGPIAAPTFDPVPSLKAEPDLSADLYVDPDHENDILRLVTKYLHRDTLSQDLKAKLSDQMTREWIQGLMKAHINLVESRPVKIQKGQVTIFDKALVTLTMGGRDLDCEKAIALFCEEILGIVSYDPGRRNGAGGGKDTGGGKIEAAIQERRTHVMRGGFVEKREENTWYTDPDPIHRGYQDEYSTEAKPESAYHQSSITQLITVFRTAKTEYEVARHGSDKQGRAEAAIFLRDTCENLMFYLRQGDNEGELDAEEVREIVVFRDMAAADAVVLSDGRKRKFDLTERDKRAGTGGSGWRATEESGQYLTDRARGLDGIGDEMRAKKRRNEPWQEIEDGHHPMQSRSGRPRSSSSRYHEPKSYTLSRAEKKARASIRHERRYRDPDERRVPFYSRRVDSYVPGQ